MANPTVGWELPKINSENLVCLSGPRLYGQTAVRILSRGMVPHMDQLKIV